MIHVFVTMLHPIRTFKCSRVQQLHGLGTKSSSKHFCMVEKRVHVGKTMP